MNDPESPKPTPPRPQPANPLHGITLEMVVNHLVEVFGWEEMGRRVPIRCFIHDPSVKSSLVFLRKTPWARQRVEGWYIAEKRRESRRKKPRQK
jgi:uncharacterized protein (DUF2132 family)